MSRALQLLRAVAGATIALGSCAQAASLAKPLVALKTSFQPDRSGKSTTLGFGFEISQRPADALPPPLTSVSLLLPAEMGLAPTTLGLANCSTSQLVAHGLSGCSPNARIGFGTAVAAVPLGQEVIRESVKVTALAGPAATDRLSLLFYADGESPIIAKLVFPGSLGETLTTTIPAIATLPGAPTVTILRFSSSIGPAGLVYHIQRHGKTVPFRPTGMVVPVHCPRGGFPFAASFTFQGGYSAKATASVPCPERRRHGHSATTSD